MAASEIAAGGEQHRGHEDDRQKLHASHVKPTNNDVSHALLLTMNGSGLKKDPIISFHMLSLVWIQLRNRSKAQLKPLCHTKNQAESPDDPVA